MPKINYLALNLENSFTTELKIICDNIQSILNSQGYDFIPMEQDDLHMTLVFLGSVLSQDRNNKMKEIVLNIVKFEEQFKDKTLEFDSFELFPSEKRNLIVAKFKCSSSTFIKDMILYKKSFTNIGAKEENYFTPHITLGKIQCVKSDNNIDTLFSSFPTPSLRITINGCHLV